MKSYADFRRTDDGFLRDLRGNLDEAAKSLSAVCAQSTDPKVTAAYARWLTMNELVTFLEKSRRERAPA